MIAVKGLFLAAFMCIVIEAQTLSKESTEKVREIHESCIKSTSVDQALVEKAMKGEYDDDEKLKKHLLCCNQKMEFQDEKGNVQVEAMVNKLVKVFPQEDLVRSAVKQCAVQKDTPENTAYEMVKCMHSLAPKDWDVSFLL